MSQALQLRETDTMAEWGVMREQAVMLVKSKFLPKSIETPEQALAIILTGRELGIGIMQALNNINVISGKPTVPPQLMLALINRTGALEGLSIDDDGQSCTVTMKRRGREPHSESFSMKDAALMKTTEYINGNKQTISLSEKYNWKQQPAVMRKWRAVAACARVVFPDVILGLYTPDEMGAHTDVETGEVIEVAPVRAVPGPTESENNWPSADEPIEAEPEPVRTCEFCHSQPSMALRYGKAICMDCQFKIPNEKPEPVRNVKLEGAQPQEAQCELPEGLQGPAALVVSLAKNLSWNEADVIAQIQQAFGEVVYPGALKSYLELASKEQLRELYRAINSKGKRR